MIAAAAAGAFLVYRHLNGNIRQPDISGLLGRQPADTHPQAENILVIGSDTRSGQGGGYGKNLTTDQSDTLMIVHLPADRKWAEVMSIPRDSWVAIPSCEMGNGQMASPTTFKINEAFAIGNLDGNNTSLGVACTVKTVEADTGIYINHFVAVNFTGFKDMVAALGGVEECNTQPINDPKSGLRLPAGYHLLTPAQALGYVRARYTLGNGSDLDRISRQQAFMASLVDRARSKLLDPVAIYRFLDAATRSLTIDSGLGGVRGLYGIARSLRSLPAKQVAFFTLPTYPRSKVVPRDTANVLWTQPKDSRIFASFRADVPASPSLFGGKFQGQGQTAASAHSSHPGSAATSAGARQAHAVAPTPGVTAGQAAGTGRAASPRASPSPEAASPNPEAAGATPAPASPGQAPSSIGPSASSAGPAASSPDPGASPPGSPFSARIANQNICTG